MKWYPWYNLVSKGSCEQIFTSWQRFRKTKIICSLPSSVDVCNLLSEFDVLCTILCSCREGKVASSEFQLSFIYDQGMLNFSPDLRSYVFLCRIIDWHVMAFCRESGANWNFHSERYRYWHKITNPRLAENHTQLNFLGDAHVKECRHVIWVDVTISPDLLVPG